MVGTVFFQEMTLGGRRFQLHVFRWVYAGWLVLQVFFFFFAYLLEAWKAQAPVGSTPEIVGARFANTFVWQQVVLLMVVVPAVVAGSITDEKRKGTLQHLLLTEMEPRHIILGKLLGRVCQVLLVMLAGLPLFALLAGFGGVPPLTMLLVGASLLMPLFGLAAITILASVWCQQTRDAVFAVYGAGLALAVGIVVVGGPLRSLDPLFVIEPAWAPEGASNMREAVTRLLTGGAVWAILGALCLVLGSWRLTPAYLAEVLNEGQKRPSWFNEEREPIEEDPVLWRERHVEGLSPTAAWRRFPQWLGITLVAALTTLSGLFVLWNYAAKGTTLPGVCRALLSLNVREFQAMVPGAHVGFLVQGVVVMLLFSLLVGIRCSGSITGERECQTWEAVLLTPMSARQVLDGKLWGVMNASAWYLLAYAGPAMALSVLGGPLAFGYVVLWFAVTVLAMYFMGAAGLWCSAQATNSWRGLLNTMLVGYLGGLAIYTVAVPLIAILAALVLLLLALVDLILKTSIGRPDMTNLMQVFAVSSGIGLAVIFFLLSRLFLSRAQRWIADRERTRHWYPEDEAYYRRSRRASLGDAPD